MDVMMTLQSTVTGLQTAGQIAKSIHQLITSAEVKAKVIELQDAILSAQQSALSAQSEQFSMIQRVRDLEEEIARVKAWEEEKKRYKLVSPWSASFVYALKESCNGAEPPHWICAKCYDDGRRTVLQPKKVDLGFINLTCPTCKSEVHTGLRGIGQPSYAQD